MKTPELVVEHARRPWSQHAGVLLVASGVLVGLGFPLTKQAVAAGIPGALWVALSACGASVALLVLVCASGQMCWPSGRQWRYAAVAGPLTFAGPNLLVYAVVPHVGAGFSGIMFALSPVFTVALARLFGMGNIGLLRKVGIGLGLSGAIGISLARGNVLPSAALVWLLLALIIPIVLAAGNLYRSLDWPRNSAPEWLALLSHTVAFVVYGCIAVLQGYSPGGIVAREPVLILSQLCLAALTAPLVFRLQRYGGPVTLSQLGYVAAATSLLIAALLLGEHYSIGSWLSFLLISAGIGVTVAANKS